MSRKAANGAAKAAHTQRGRGRPPRDEAAPAKLVAGVTHGIDRLVAEYRKLCKFRPLLRLTDESQEMVLAMAKSMKGKVGNRY